MHTTKYASCSEKKSLENGAIACVVKGTWNLIVYTM